MIRVRPCITIRASDDMPRNRKVITFSMPPEMAEQLQEVVREDGRTMSEFLREAIRSYMDEREWLRQERRQRVIARRDEQEQATGGADE